jgi:hypothetical protein
VAGDGTRVARPFVRLSRVMGADTPLVVYLGVFSEDGFTLKATFIAMGRGNRR